MRSVSPFLYTNVSVVIDTYSDQETVTHEYVDASWSCLGNRRNSVKIYKYRHYRLLVKEAGDTLNNFRNGLELFQSASDVLEGKSSMFPMSAHAHHVYCSALKTAYDSEYLHRDVSYTNIILFRSAPGERRKALLIDWEYACSINENRVARDHLISVSLDAS